MHDQQKTLTAPGEGKEQQHTADVESYTASVSESEQAGKRKVTPIRDGIAVGPLDLGGLDLPTVGWNLRAEMQHHVSSYARPGKKSWQALDASYWAHRVSELGHLGWYHGDLYGLVDDTPIYRPITSHVEAFVECTANALQACGVTKIGKTRSRVSDVVWHLEHGSIARPSDTDWLVWDREQWNRPQGIPFTNGLLDLQTLTLRSITPEDRLTWQLPFQWVDTVTLDAGAFWAQHFTNLFGNGPGAQSKVRTLLVRSAVALTPWVRGARWQKALMLIGPGENGKGTWIRLWEHIMGNLYQTMALHDYDDDSRFGLSGLRPETLVAGTPDMDEKARLKGTARFKSLTGDDPLSWERKNRDLLTTQFKARVWLAGPVVPKVSDSSQGMFRRLDGGIIHFDRKQQKDDAYENRMLSRENVEALLHLAIIQLAQVVDGSAPMPRPNDSDELLREYRQQISPIEQWLGEEGWLEAVDGPDAGQAFVSTDRLLQVYRHWYQQYTGERYPKYMSRVEFGRKLQSQFAKSQRDLPDGRRPHGYRGVRVRPEWDRVWTEE